MNYGIADPVTVSLAALESGMYVSLPGNSSLLNPRLQVLWTLRPSRPPSGPTRWALSSSAGSRPSSWLCAAACSRTLRIWGIFRRPSSRGWSARKQSTLLAGRCVSCEAGGWEGWLADGPVERSCGKEKLANDRADTLKGSYYVNCAFYKDPALDGADGDYPDLPEYTRGNMWPRDGLLVGFRETIQELVGTGTRAVG